jgi:hypothetical protein
MPRTRIPDISAFIRFHELDPRIDNQCIYITRKNARCSWPNSNSDKAKDLYARLTQRQGNGIDVGMLHQYIVSICCRSGRAQHRDRIVDVGLLPLLVKRWQDEIMAEVQNRLRSDLDIPDTVSTTVSSPLSEFRPHVAELTADKSVACKIQDNLEDRDFECGSLYIFDRMSSPGHVKIGWTARTVKDRLNDWSRCGYVPNLLFSEQNIPSAQRAETLAHYELIHEWRRERMCKADWCRKSHYEWFEVSVERAIKVVGDWASLFKVAPLYDVRGSWEPHWRSVVKELIKDGEMVTGHMLRLRLPNLQPSKQMPLQGPAESINQIQSESEGVHQATLPKLHRREEDLRRLGSIPIEQQSMSKVSIPLSQSLPELGSPLREYLATAVKRTKSFSTMKTEAVSENDSEPFDLRVSQSLSLWTSLVRTVPKTQPIIKAEIFD